MLKFMAEAYKIRQKYHQLSCTCLLYIYIYLFIYKHTHTPQSMGGWSQRERS